MTTDVDKQLVAVPTAQTFLHNEELIQEGDTVIIYVNAEHILSVVVKRGLTCDMKHGALRHEFLIGKRYGTRLSATAGSIYALRPYPALWTKVLKRHTQILYTQEISMIISLLNLKPGDLVCESGTGSGSLTHALACTVGAYGHVYTHDVEEAQFEKIKNEIREHGLESCVTPCLRNVCVDGFQVDAKCCAIFLDLPAPWLAVPHALKVFDRSRVCRLVSFSPCIEQVQQLCELLHVNELVGTKTVELIGTTFRVERSRHLSVEDLEIDRNGRKAAGMRRKARNVVNPNPMESQENDTTQNSMSIELADLKLPVLLPSPHQQPSHAGYLTSATLFPSR